MVANKIEPIRKPTPKVRERKPLRSKLHTIPSRVREEVFTAQDYVCAWCGVPGGALDCHHRLRRSQGGKDDSPRWMVGVHRLCHDAIHREIAEAKRRRFIVSTEAGLSEPWT